MFTKQLVSLRFGIALIALPLSAEAQGAAPAAGWQGWVGCWTATPLGEVWESGSSAARVVCVAPGATADVADLTVVAEGKVVSRDRIDASGTPSNIDTNGCTGTEQAKWSSDRRRVYLKSLVGCQGISTAMSAIVALTPGGEWLDVRSFKVKEGQKVRVTRYRSVDIPVGTPADVAAAITSRRTETHVARSATGAAVGSAAIIEASKVVDAEVVEAWVMENGQRYAIDDRSLRELLDAGVPSLVTDAMLAATEPEQSPLTRIGGRYGYTRPYGRGASDAWDQGTGMRVPVKPYAAFLDPWSYGGWPFGYRYGYAPYGYSYGFVSGNGYGYGYATNGFGYGIGFPMERSVVGYLYPDVMVLHQDPSGAARSKNNEAAAETKQKGAGAAAVADIIAKARGAASSDSSSKGTVKGGTNPPRPTGLGTVKSGGAPNR